jgi:hypothetical protein
MSIFPGTRAASARFGHAQAIVRCGEPVQFSMVGEDFRPQSQPTRPLLRATGVYTISE